MKMPKTPFSTYLSGSAKETELRLRSIFRWKKKRPPIVGFMVILLLLVACCNLVGFAPANAAREKVPALVWERDAVEVPGGVIYATGFLGTANLYWKQDGQAPICFRKIIDVKVSTLNLDYLEKGGVLQIEYIQPDYEDARYAIITTLYQVNEETAPEGISSRASWKDML